MGFVHRRFKLLNFLMDSVLKFSGNASSQGNHSLRCSRPTHSSKIFVERLGRSLKAARVIYNLPWNTPTDEVFQYSKWNTLTYYYRLFHSVFKGEAPAALSHLPINPLLALRSKFAFSFVDPIQEIKIKHQVNSSCAIMSVILMTTLFYKALILQGEI